MGWTAEKNDGNNDNVVMKSIPSLCMMYVGEMKTEKVCCHAEDEMDPKQCNIPWAHLEHLKFPDQDHDNAPKFRLSESNSTRGCLWGNQSLTLDTLGIGHTFLWSKWPYNNNGRACGQTEHDLLCEGEKTKTEDNFFHRIAYHLFFSLHSDNNLVAFYRISPVSLILVRGVVICCHRGKITALTRVCCLPPLPGITGLTSLLKKSFVHALHTARVT